MSTKNQATHVIDVELTTGEAVSIYRTKGNNLIGIDGSWLDSQFADTDQFFDPIDGSLHSLVDDSIDTDKDVTVATLEPQNYWYLFGDDWTTALYESDGVGQLIFAIKLDPDSVVWDIESWKSLGYDPDKLANKANSFGNVTSLTKQDYEKLSKLNQ